MVPIPHLVLSLRLSLSATPLHTPIVSMRAPISRTSRTLRPLSNPWGAAAGGPIINLGSAGNTLVAGNVSTPGSGDAGARALSGGLTLAGQQAVPVLTVSVAGPITTFTRGQSSDFRIFSFSLATVSKSANESEAQQQQQLQQQKELLKKELPRLAAMQHQALKGARDALKEDKERKKQEQQDKAKQMQKDRKHSDGKPVDDADDDDRDKGNDGKDKGKGDGKDKGKGDNGNDKGKGDNGGDKTGKGDNGGDKTGKGDNGGDKTGKGDNGGDKTGKGDNGGDKTGKGDNGGDKTGKGDNGACPDWSVCVLRVLDLRSGGAGGFVRVQHEELPNFPSQDSINTVGQVTTFGATNIFGWTRAIVRSFGSALGTNRTRVQSQGGGFGTGITSTSVYTVGVTQLQEVLCKPAKDGKGWQQEERQEAQGQDQKQKRIHTLREGDKLLPDKAELLDTGNGDGSSYGGSGDGSGDALSELLRAAAVAPLPGDLFLSDRGGGSERDARNVRLFVEADEDDGGFKGAGVSDDGIGRATRSGGRSDGKGKGNGKGSGKNGVNIASKGVIYNSADECEEALRQQAEQQEKQEKQRQQQQQHAKHQQHQHQHQQQQGKH
ncbi:hypothetical protein VOLCADRAFT_94418 [Volvox carteri f. nagariensis]|uniref:Uncharacterized protein n=1 Tax=Volvox carteri f. nagariensis TaxID=3068 RepID=D8U4R3_VOLCA|nr:uncharacterized protein VOLCADRAFT_94418 [Volvox carteri f. nagariensis]EFJ45233.1 hypothetical protein VOLCADRAFT_94418 [Volvox carteri f. nagariensis]|eukprot:XP_002953609.1 hypothetical protein VOLCADRAFT_94418 [Volvox carteri f. nagariensis]